MLMHIVRQGALVCLQGFSRNDCQMSGYCLPDALRSLVCQPLVSDLSLSLIFTAEIDSDHYHHFPWKVAGGPYCLKYVHLCTYISWASHVFQVVNWGKH